MGQSSASPTARSSSASSTVTEPSAANRPLENRRRRAEPSQGLIQSREAALVDGEHLLAPLAEFLDACRKRLLRSGQFIGSPVSQT